MRKFTRTLLLSLLFVTPVVALSWPTDAASKDCNLIAQLCRESNARLYELCVAITGDLSTCAWQEAANNIKCIADSGCAPAPKPPPDN